MSSTSGIYLIVCLINNKFYVGSAINTIERWRLHRLELNRNNHHNRHLQAAWSLYGEANFQFYVIEFTSSDLENREQHWIEHLNATDHLIGYNICKASRNRSGVKASDETRKRLSLAHKGNKHSEETKAKMSLSRMGNQINKGRKQKSEHIQKRIASNTGKKRTDEALANISASLKGRSISDEARKNMSIAARNRKKKLDTKSSLWV